MDAGNCQKDLKKFSKEEGKKGWGGGQLAVVFYLWEGGVWKNKQMRGDGGGGGG